ncbi:hypothetical protein [Aliiglaciecola sp. LCG003]|uniref:hypothetical protein n=1 Tax=Aliiglaciecola sp. LCG003 TaxID=3053655 RepID=UPI00257311A7|nr:hypothetical protein [Aliiglaciecola sp. LCG003]WJG10293.1 hypothetical protein QR722_04460 [Aliiglaciecola sp. LCG003]
MFKFTAATIVVATALNLVLFWLNLIHAAQVCSNMLVAVVTSLLSRVMNQILTLKKINNTDDNHNRSPFR